MKNIDLKKLNMEFLNNGYCHLNILNHFKTELDFIQNDLAIYDSKYWSYIIKYGDFEKDIPVNKFSDKIKKHYENSIQHHSLGQFAFFFKRMCQDHNLDIPITKSFNLAYKLVNSSEFTILLEKITGRNIGNTSQFYINQFDKGEFLGIHSDRGNNIGIAINITKNWLPTFGGVTHIFHQSLDIIDSLTPTFGEMFIFDSKSKEIPHFVSTVSVRRPEKRMAIIVRFD
ncbi:2OG-Fe(II) oxygenase family protein [Aliivibrio fischeri]|uniref:2OG-Fe(II) oxygenase family protein n=1 Tax=Aliivibrio fischeri TaxID=668 RepID=UPI003F766CDF